MKKYVSGKEYLGLVVGEEEVMDPFFFSNNQEFFGFTNTEALVVGPYGSVFSNI